MYRRGETRSLKIIIGTIAVCMSLYHLYTAAFGILPVLLHRSIHLTFALVLVFLIFPFDGKGQKTWILCVDIFFSILSFLTIGYIALYYEEISMRMPLASPVSNFDFLFGLISIFLILEATRRTVGLPLVLIVIAGLFYVHVSAEWSVKDIISFMYLSLEGIFGIPLGVSATYAFLFILFGAFLYTTGIGHFFISLATAVAGAGRGGPAKISVIASALFGTISGATIANVYGTGNLTIPMMKRMGYKPEFAGAVEAVASTGGQIMPPVMGAVAFVMADVTGIPYIEIAKSATLPAILYFFALIMMIHFEACKKGLSPLPRNEIPAWYSILRNSYLIIPIIFLVYIIVQGYTPFRAAFFSILAALAISSMKKETRLGIKGLLFTLEKGAKESLMIATATASAGLIVAVIAMTGLGLQVTNVIISLSKGTLLIPLLLSMVACMILGMGLPTVPAYIIVAAISVPTLIKLGVPIMGAHLFALYFAIIAVITPPVALAAYAGASIAGSNMFKTGLFAFRLGSVAYVVPYMFIYSPLLLLMGNWRGIGQAIITALVGVVGLAAGMEKWFLRDMKIYEILLFIMGGLLLIFPGWRTDLPGILCIGAGLLSQYFGKGKG